MTVNHAWKKQQVKPPKSIPIDQVESLGNTCARRGCEYGVQIALEQMLITLNEDFGFGRERCMRAFDGVKNRPDQWTDDVNLELDAEMFQMNFKERRAHRAELAYVIQKHDAKLEPLVDPDIWQPFRERYKSFGGSGSWCE